MPDSRQMRGDQVNGRYLSVSDLLRYRDGTEFEQNINLTVDVHLSFAPLE